MTRKLTLYPDARPIAATPDGAELGVSDMRAALHAVRCAWADHRDIVTLPEWGVVAYEGVSGFQRFTIEDRMAHLIFDLGNSSLDAWWGARNAIANSVSCATEPKHDALKDYARGRPVVCVASGPTASAHFPAVHMAQTAGAIVVCADSIYKALVAYGIEPDLVCVLERPDIFASIVPAELTTRTILVCPPVVAPATAAGWMGRRVWFWQETAGLYPWLGPDVRTDFSGRSAGTLAVAVSIILGGSAVYLVGHDLCRVGSDSHAPGVGAFTVEGQAKSEAEAPPMGIFAPCLALCNDGESRKSTRFWDLCRQDIEAMARNKPNIYSVDKRGSAISGTIPLDSVPVSQAPAGPIRMSDLRVTPSRYRAHLKKQILDDSAAFHRAGSGMPIKDAMLAMQPCCWAHRDTAELHSYVLGTIYHAASLRMHLRADDPLRLGMGVLRRGIQPMLQTMAGDLC